MGIAISHVGDHQASLKITNNVSATPIELTNKSINPDNIKIYKNIHFNLLFFLFFNIRMVLDFVQMIYPRWID